MESGFLLLLFFFQVFVIHPVIGRQQTQQPTFVSELRRLKRRRSSLSKLKLCTVGQRVRFIQNYQSIVLENKNGATQTEYHGSEGVSSAASQPHTAAPSSLQSVRKWLPALALQPVPAGGGRRRHRHQRSSRCCYRYSFGYSHERCILRFSHSPLRPIPTLKPWHHLSKLRFFLLPFYLTLLSQFNCLEIPCLFPCCVSTI